MGSTAQPSRRFRSEPFPRFNFEAMSGVHTGSRTREYFRVRLWPASPAAWDVPAAESPRTDAGDAYQELHWHTVQIELGPEAGVAIHIAPMRSLPQSGPGLNARLSVETLDELPQRFAVHGWSLHACGVCRHWRQRQPGAGPVPATGTCAWGRQWTDDLPATHPLMEQSALATGCVHWSPDDESQPLPPGQVEEATGFEPFLAALPRPQNSPPGDRPGIWHRVSKWWRRTRASSPSDGALLRERSGVGAGTEPCFACHGRLANLGALVVESESRDTQTYSIWRCRQCAVTLLNRWIDRWVRTETLETDETYYRIAPAEAAVVLLYMRTVPNADHPQASAGRAAQRLWFEEATRHADLISHTIKLGR